MQLSKQQFILLILCPGLIILTFLLNIQYDNEHKYRVIACLCFSRLHVPSQLSAGREEYIEVETVSC